MITQTNCLKITVFVLAVIAAVCVLAFAEQRPAIQGSAIFDWNAIPDWPTSFGSGRQFFKGPTATLEQLDVHVTTLNPGQAPHTPHQHANEELIIVKEGMVEFLLNGEWKKARAGSVIFVASNQLHGLRNPGPGPATYHVISWISRSN